MNQQKSLLNVSELLSRFKVQVGILNASSMLDINIVAENFLIPILNEVFDYSLINANTISKNYPAVDLVDKVNRVSFQITSTSKPAKIKTTLEKIVTNNFHLDYDKFYIVIISNKAEKYDETMIADATQNKFHFTNKNILDIETLFEKISSLNINKIQLIEKYLVSQYSDVNKVNDILIKYSPSILKILEKDNQHYIASKLKNACISRQKWYNKKSFFEQNLASIYDLEQKFSIEEKITECDKKIIFYEEEIYSVTSQIANNHG